MNCVLKCIFSGFFIGLTLTGPVAGFLLGSLSSAIYVSLDAHDLKPTDPAWIGAWWLGKKYFYYLRFWIFLTSYFVIQVTSSLGLFWFYF